MRDVLESGDRLRPATFEDVDAITSVVAAAELAAHGVVDVDREDVEAELSLPSVEPGKHSVVIEADGSVVAWALLEAERGAAYADVHPSRRGKGIGSALLEWIERSAREAGLAEVGQTRSDAETDAHALLRARGWSPRWTSWLLEFLMGDAEPPAPEVPEGIRLRGFEPGRDDREVHRLVDDAFGEWEGRAPQSFEEWAGHSVGRETFDSGLSPLALDGDEIVGAAISLAYPNDDDGYVHQLAVKQTHRNRGIARALLQQAFLGFHRMGRRSVVLSTESRTGALAMYARLGMRVRRSYTSYAKAL
jgi:ribosomal protein S18 acetylase RimI-like enzyme